MIHRIRQRGSLILWALVTAMLFLTAGGAAAQEERFDGVTLRVATYGGSWRNALHELIGKDLEKRGAKVEWVLGNPRDNLVKLIAARGRDLPFDVMEMDDSTKPQLFEAELLEELKPADLPNARALPDRMRDRYTVATSLIEVGIVYNVKKFQELGIPKIVRFKDLFHPKLAGRVSFPDINVGTAFNALVGFAIEAGGDESNIVPGLELIKQLKVAGFHRSAMELATKFKSEDVWAAPWHAGMALRLKRDGVPAAISYQKVRDKEGMLQVVWGGIPKGTKARRAAQFFLNRYIDPAVQLQFTEKVGSVPANEAALAQLATRAELRDVPTILEPAKIRNMYYIDWFKVDFNDWIGKWSRMMAR